MLLIAADTADDQALWVKAVSDCSRVTMENALLGDSIIEKLRAEGTAAEAETAAACKALEEEAMRIKLESEEKLRLIENADVLLEQAKMSEVSCAWVPRDLISMLFRAARRYSPPRPRSPLPHAPLDYSA